MILTLTLEFPNNYSKECVLWRNVTSSHRHVYAQNIPRSPGKAPFPRSYRCTLFEMFPSTQTILDASTLSTLNHLPTSPRSSLAGLYAGA